MTPYEMGVMCPVKVLQNRQEWWIIPSSKGWKLEDMVLSENRIPPVPQIFMLI